MRVFGIAVTMEGEQKATAYGVVLDDSSGSPVIETKFEITNDEADLSTRLYDMAENIRTKVDSLRPDRVAIRRADFPPTQSRKEAPKVRMFAEGALASAARSKCVLTYLGTGKDFGAWCGSDKDTVEAEAKTLAKASPGIPQKYAFAISAALGALAHS
ncbi:MAG: hypothetical protein JWO76_1624 [Nocardioides sp.]|nr:hypothetical protein [Nocardioides sp.]